MTATLLGTDRRPPTFLGLAADADPALSLLDHAARSAVAQRAVRRLPTDPADPPPVLDQPPLAPARAQLLLADLLARPVAPVLTAWLRAAARRGLTAAPHHWPALDTLASRQAGIDRTALAIALGPRGRWFCAQNPAWRRLAAELTARSDPAVVSTAADTPPTEVPPEVTAEIERSFRTRTDLDPTADLQEVP